MLMMFVLLLLNVSILSAMENDSFQVSVAGFLDELSLGQTEVYQEKAIRPKHLILIAKNGMAGVCKKYLEGNVSVSQKDDYGISPLYYAMKKLHRHALNKRQASEVTSDVQKIIAKKAAGYTEVVNAIIDHKTFDPALHYYEEENETTYPLDWAVKFKQHMLFPSLLSKNSMAHSRHFLKNIAPLMHKVYPSVRDTLSKKSKFLQKVISHSNKKSLAFLIGYYKPCPKLLSRALYHAFKDYRDIDMKLLIEYGASLNYRSKKHKKTLLIEYAKSSSSTHESVMKALIPLIKEHNACDPAQQIGSSGNNPFHYILKSKWFDYDEEKCIQYMLELGISPREVNDQKETPLHVYASTNNARDCDKRIEFCKKHGLNFQAKNEYGYTAAQCTNNETIKKAIEDAAKIEAKPKIEESEIEESDVEESDEESEIATHTLETGTES
jgi:ankyrin repeat protein